MALGALDIDSVSDGLAALLPDAVSAAEVANALGVPEVRVSPAVARDDHSIWTLSRPAIRSDRWSSCLPIARRSRARCG